MGGFDGEKNVVYLILFYLFFPSTGFLREKTITLVGSLCVLVFFCCCGEVGEVREGGGRVLHIYHGANNTEGAKVHESARTR